jgi:MFS superfamily sulfate permease-like transporter
LLEPNLKMMQILLPIHILAGTIALFCAAMAVSSEKGKKLHVLSGRTYFWCMVAIFLTAIPMSIITSNIFLFLIAFFSFYLAFAGIRFARNRKGIATTSDWIAVGLMLLSGVGMWILAAIYFMNNNSQYIPLLVFGFLAIVLGYGDFKSHKNKTAIGKERIGRHLGNMMGGTIAVITAVLVVNVNIEPVWIWWVLPTALITPVIIWWKIKVMK